MNVLNTWVNFLEDTWVLQRANTEIKEKQVRYVFMLQDVMQMSFIPWNIYLSVINSNLISQVMSWLNMRAIMWTWSLNCFRLMRYTLYTKNILSWLYAVLVFIVLSCYTGRIEAFCWPYWEICRQPEELKWRVIIHIPAL